MNLDHVKFIDTLTKNIEKLGIDLQEATLDHIAYQASSSEEYESLKLEFEKVAKLIKEPLVGGRKVGVFKYSEPQVYKDQTFEAVELIEPKKDQKCPSGLEHAEFLLPVTLEEFIEKYPNIDWNTDAVNREQFPMLILKLTDHTRVKFPRYPILSK